MKKQTVVVFGGGGYVGSVLVPRLLEDDYKVRVFDTFWYGEEVFANFRENPDLELIKADIRDVNSVKLALQNVQCVIHLACISNDPSFDLNPELGRAINLESFSPIVESAKSLGINHFIYASSSSVYGIKSEDKVTEQLSLEPLTDYSKFKAMCEEIILEKNSEDFVCTVLRPATVCGVSPRQRFDLSVNILTNHAISSGKITVFGGSQSRPNLDIRDMARAYLHILQRRDRVAGEIFNVGGENLTLNSIAEKVKLQLGTNTEIQHKPTDDLRSYRVDSSKILDRIGFKPSYSVDDSINELKNAFKSGAFINSLENSKYFNIKRMKELALA
jgi:nucleoside-diphosphate-sugar epimerase